MKFDLVYILILNILGVVSYIETFIFICFYFTKVILLIKSVYRLIFLPFSSRRLRFSQTKLFCFLGFAVLGYFGRMFVGKCLLRAICHLLIVVGPRSPSTFRQKSFPHQYFYFLYRLDLLFLSTTIKLSGTTIISFSFLLSNNLGYSCL